MQENAERHLLGEGCQLEEVQKSEKTPKWRLWLLPGRRNCVGLYGGSSPTQMSGRSNISQNHRDFPWAPFLPLNTCKGLSLSHLSQGAVLGSQLFCTLCVTPDSAAALVPLSDVSWCLSLGS